MCLSLLYIYLKHLSFISNYYSFSSLILLLSLGFVELCSVFYLNYLFHFWKIVHMFRFMMHLFSYYFLMHILSQGSAFGLLLSVSILGDLILFRGFKYNLSRCSPKCRYLIPDAHPDSRLTDNPASLTSLPVISQASHPMPANVHTPSHTRSSVNFCISDSPVFQLSRLFSFFGPCWLDSYLTHPSHV